MIGHCRQWKPLPGSKSCSPGSDPHKFPGRDERITHMSDPSNTGNERTVFRKKKKKKDSGGPADWDILEENQLCSTPNCLEQPWVPSLGLRKLCREHAVHAICKIRTKHIVGKGTHFRGRHARVAQILVESQLKRWECPVKKILAGKSGKLLVEAVWRQKYGLYDWGRGKGNLGSSFDFFPFVPSQQNVTSMLNSFSMRLGTSCHSPQMSA